MLKQLLSISILLLSFTFQLRADGGAECIRILTVDPQGNAVTIQNLTLSTIDITDYRLCSLFSYGDIGDQVAFLGDPSAIAPNEFVILSWDLNNVDSDVALYLPTGVFSDPNSMVDFMQYGAAGNGRETEANTAGLWVAGTFVTGANGAVWSGSCSDHGVEFWFTTTSIEEWNSNTMTIGPNPINESIEIQLSSPLTSSGIINVMDITGKIIHKESLGADFSTRQTIGTSDWTSGFYLVQFIYGDEIVETRRMIKE